MKLIYELPAPFVSATHWCIIDRKKGDLLFGRRENESRQVASLTKIMTSTVVLDTLDKFGDNCLMNLNSPVRVPRSAAALNGTTAHLIADDTLTIF